MLGHLPVHCFKFRGKNVQFLRMRGTELVGRGEGGAIDKPGQAPRQLVHFLGTVPHFCRSYSDTFALP